MRLSTTLFVGLAILFTTGLVTFWSRPPAPPQQPSPRPPLSPVLDTDHIVVDKATNRLCLFRDGEPDGEYPVATGREPGSTPEGTFYIAEMAPEPGGEYGSRWIGLACPQEGKIDRGIHGTDQPKSIGGYESAGCIRMHNPDVEELYNLVYPGMPVVIQ